VFVDVAEAVRREEREQLDTILHKYYVYPSETGEYQYDPSGNQLIEIIRGDRTNRIIVKWFSGFPLDTMQRTSFDVSELLEALTPPTTTLVRKSKRK